MSLDVLSNRIALNKIIIKRVASSFAVLWCLTLGIYIERSMDSSPATNDSGSSLRLVADGESDLYVNAYVEMSNSTRLGIPYLLQYTGPTRPYGLAVAVFAPGTSTNDRVAISTVTVASPGRLTTHAVDETSAFTSFETTDGRTLACTIRCGSIIPSVGKIKLEIHGTVHSGAVSNSFSQTLSLVTEQTTYVYPGWCFVFLPMSG